MYTVEPSSKLVRQWCKAVEDTVTLRIRGTVFGDMIKGKVVDCLKRNCTARNHPYCWLEHIIQTKI
ncbi:MAG: hypothetical protein QXP06_07460 [Candidatus Bathyarchaeia archaeon]